MRGGGGGQQPTVFVPPGLVDQIFNPISWFENLFDFLFGGGGHQQVVIPRKLRHRPHIIFAQYSGVSKDIIVSNRKNNDQYTRGLITSPKNGRLPEFRNGTPKLPFGACVGITSAFTLPTVAACVVYGIGCGGGDLPACVPAFGACTFEASILIACHEQALGKSTPAAPNYGFPPPGDPLQPGPSGIPYGMP